MKKFSKYICWMCMCVGLAACTNEDYPLYDTGQKDSVFLNYFDSKNEAITSVDYAFSFDIKDSHVVEIPVSLMGMPSEHDRSIAIVPVAEETTMEEGKHYVIESAVLPAKATETILKIRLLRSGPQIKEKAFQLTFFIGENDVLRSVGENRFTITYSDIEPEKPTWWNQWVTLPAYSFEVAQIFFQYFYERAPKADIGVFNEIINRYGDYFANFKEEYGGPLDMYRTFFIKHVMMPMYEEHPDLPWNPAFLPKL